ncbi:MAG: NAD-dependent protein deacylase [Hydrogenophaga sp.]|nr:NAD-dependent protein deacylase [Hydrogenophaga sp.]
MLEALRETVRAARAITVLSGAGMSAESGVPTFRDALTGLWARFDPQQLATEEAFRRDPRLVWDWYAERREAIARVGPNAGHLALAGFQQRHPGRLTVITQNVDGLHQRAGSPGVLALHGNIADDRWLEAPRACCGQGPIASGRPPHCPACGNLRRPAVVWFGEMLPEAELEAAQAAAEGCDLMLVVGTSGEVYPAAGLASVARRAGARVVIVNPHETALDNVAHQWLRQTAAVALPALLAD